MYNLIIVDLILIETARLNINTPLERFKMMILTTLVQLVFITKCNENLVVRGNEITSYVCVSIKKVVENVLRLKIWSL